MRYVAAQAHIDMDSPEPNRQFEKSELLQLFSRDEVEYKYFANNIPHWYKSTDSLSFEEWIHLHHLKHQQEKGEKDFDYSFSHMQEIHEQIFHGTFDFRHESFFKSIIDPVYESTVINRISRRSNIIRDTYIVSKIKEYWQQGLNIFVVYGASHAVMQEPALQCLSE